MRHLLTVGLVLAIVAPLSAQTIVRHRAFGPDDAFAGEPDQPDVAYTIGWDAWNGRAKPPLKGWNTTSEGVTSAQFVKAELQAAIDDAVAMYGGWQAQLLITQVDWVGTPMTLSPVVGSADVGSTTGYIAWNGDGANDHPLQRVYDHDNDPNTPDQMASWLGDGRQNGTHRNTGPGTNGQWTYAGTGYGMCHDAVAAGVADGGASLVNTSPGWFQAYGTSYGEAIPCWTAVIDATDVVQHYLSSDALLLFVSSLEANGPTVFSANQWGGGADIRVLITPEPVSLALLAMGGLVALRRRR